MILITCPACKRRLSVQDETAGKKVKCPACGEVTRCPPKVAATVGAEDMRQPLASTVVNPDSSAASAQPASLACQETLEPARARDKAPTGGPAQPALLARQETLDPERTLDEMPSGGADGARTVPPVVAALPGYEILAELGRGAMGVVFKARQVKLNRLVALKMILGGDLAGADGLARFHAEAEAVAKLHHPNIVQIYETGEQGGAPYFSLEFVEGGNLADKLHGAPMPPRQGAALTAILARAVHAAHQQGIVHRDLKPANILLERDGTPKIADFGLAKQLGATNAQTASGAVMGTPSYMAPEQAAGKAREVGPTADVYALGAILYEMLTGRPPFLGASAIETLMHVVKEEPLGVRQLQPGVPRDLETICRKAMARDPRRRYATAQELSEDLNRCLAGEPIRARPMGRLERLGRWCRKNPVAVGLLVAITLGSAAGLWHLSSLSRTLVEKTALDSAGQQAAMLQEARDVYSTEVINRNGPDTGKVYRKIGASTLGFLASPSGQGALLAASELLPGRASPIEASSDPHSMPIPTGFMMKLSDKYTLDQSGSGQSGVKARVFSRWPFPTRTPLVPDQFEEDALEQLEDGKAADMAEKLKQLQQEGASDGALDAILKARPDQPYYRFENYNGGRALRYAEAIRMRSTCIDCHNNPLSNSPKTDWKVGDVRGVLEIIHPLDSDESQVRQSLLNTFLFAGGVGVGLLGLIGVVLWVGRRRASATPESLPSTEPFSPGGK